MDLAIVSVTLQKNCQSLVKKARFQPPSQKSRLKTTVRMCSATNTNILVHITMASDWILYAASAVIHRSACVYLINLSLTSYIRSNRPKLYNALIY